MKPYYQDKWVKIFHGSCLDLELSGISAVVTDPPYELGFMGKSWDSRGVSFSKDTWQVIRNACKPGAMLLAFGGTRTFHRIAVAIEDAGWELRDTIGWMYGSGFPKSLNIGKAVDKIQGNERVEGDNATNCPDFPNPCKGHPNANGSLGGGVMRHASPTKGTSIWEGYGTSLKPAWEPVIVAMNPLDGTFANNALKHGVAGINIDECRVGYASDSDKKAALSGDAFKRKDFSDEGWSRPWMSNQERIDKVNRDAKQRAATGRFPANLIHDGSQQVMELFPQTKSGLMSGEYGGFGYHDIYGKAGKTQRVTIGDQGSAARFFYCAKSSKRERGEGNSHPTIKPLALMEYLCKLVKMPEYNLILDPFVGSGTTLLACIRLGIPCIGIDSDEKSCEIAARRYSQEVMELNV